VGKIAGLLLLAVACGHKPEPAPTIVPEQSYVFGDGDGQLVVGVLLPDAKPIRLVDLLTEKQLDSYKSDPTDEMPEELEPEWHSGRADSRSTYYEELQAGLSKQLGIRVLVREITESERSTVPVLLGELVSLGSRSKEVLRRVRRIDPEPFRVVRARRENGRAYVEFAQPPDRAYVVDLDGVVHWTGDPAVGFDLRGLTPYEHLLVAQHDGVRRAETLAELVGAVEREVLARSDAVAGGTYAVRLIYTNTKTAVRVQRYLETVTLTNLDGAPIATTTVVSNELGTADVRLAIPEDTAAGPANLRVGTDRFAVHIRRATRVSVTTDRTVYRANDRVFVRVMARRYPSGRALANEPIRLKYRGGERTLTTSEHGIASTEIVLRDVRPAHYKVEAICGSDRARANYKVRAFELPRFEVTFEPPRLRMRRGESAPMRLIARYVSGSPMAGATIEIGGKAYRTDEHGVIEFVARRAAWVIVRDADGRKLETHVPVTFEDKHVHSPPETPPTIRVDLTEPKVGDEIQVEVAGESGPLFLDVFRDGVLLRTASSPTHRLTLALTEDLAGSLTLHAYRFVDHEPKGHRRQLLVRRNRPLHIEAKAARDEYRPGDTALVDVKIRDKSGQPTAAVLGYWAIDQALLNLYPAMGDGHETTFDLRPRPGRKTDYDIRDRRTPRLKKLAKQKQERLLIARIGEIQDRINAIYETLPIEEYRTAASIRERLLWHVRRGEMDPATLLDPWGTPLNFERDHHRVIWSSAGPDLVWGTVDDQFRLQSVGMPETARQFFEYVEFCSGGSLRLGFWGPPEMNTAIGLGGGAGAGRRGRGGRRNLRASGGSGGPKESIRLRRESSPTLCFVPEVVVGPDGSTQLKVPLADALTTWRMRLVASTDDGATGIGFTSIRVRQPLSVEPWIAPHLTVGDDLDLPVAVHNDTTRPMHVRLKIRATGVRVIGPKEASVEIGPGKTAAHTFRILATAPGRARLRIDAAGGDEADAVERFVEVRPDGREIVVTKTARTGIGVAFQQKREGRVRLDVYPDPVAEALTGLKGMIRKPHGCFEQTSSTLYPMVLVLDYLRRTQQDRPELQNHAHKYIAAGYSMLLSYEVRKEPGGFSLWGKAPAQPSLTAYGLMEFADMKRVHAVDPHLIDRIVKYLGHAQAEDGSWDGNFNRTAYIAWALKTAGHPNKSAVAYLEKRIGGMHDPYALALAALAGVWKLIVQPWAPAGETVFWARGRSAGIETSALAAQAMLQQGSVDEARAIVSTLLERRGRDGRFGTTQSTVQALRAILAITSDGPPRPADVHVLSGGGDVLGKLHVTQETMSLDLGTTARLQVRCERDLRYTVSHTSYEPWSGGISTGRVGLNVRYPTGTLAVGKTARIRGTVFHREGDLARQVIAEIGVPPGCDIEHGLLQGAKSVERGRTAVVIYLGDLKPGERFDFEIPFEPRYRLNVKTAPSKAYEYYTPERVSVVPPAAIRAK